MASIMAGDGQVEEVPSGSLCPCRYLWLPADPFARGKSISWEHYLKLTARICANCGLEQTVHLYFEGQRFKKCGGCHAQGLPDVYYCNRECQKMQWRMGHKKVCGRANIYDQMALEDGSSV